MAIEDEFQWGGRAGGAQQDVDRYRAIAGDAGARPGASIDQTQSNAARGDQIYALEQTRGAMGQTQDAVGLAREAAYGNAPSAAEIYGGQMLDNSIDSQMAMAASARGGPTAVAGAARQAAFQGAQTQQAGARDLAAMRAQEMAGARDQYLGGTNALAGQANAYGATASGMRGQDIGVATSQAGLDNYNLDRNQGQEQFYEQMGWNTNQQSQNAAMQRQRDSDAAWAQRRALKLASEGKDWDMLKDVSAMGASATGAASSIGKISDIRAKEDIYPLSNATADWEHQFGSSDKAAGEARKHDNLAEMQHIRAGFEHGMPQQSDFGRIMSALSGGLAGGGGGAAYMPRSGGPSGGSAYVLEPGGGMDIMGTIKQQSSNAGSSGPSMMSDAQSKYIVSDDRAKNEDPLASANRAQAGSAYTYKPGFAEASGQQPGEMNVGPMAQTMASDPIAGTAVKQDPSSGLLVLDNDKLQKVQSAGIGSLQRQVDDLRRRLAASAANSSGSKRSPDELHYVPRVRP